MNEAAATAPGALPRRVFLTLFAVAASGAIGINGMQSVLPAIGREIGIPDVLVVSMFALSSLLWTVSSPFWAREADRRGHRAMILLGASGLPISMLVVGVVVILGANHLIGIGAAFAGLLIGRALFGLIGAASTPATQAFIAHNTTPEGRTRALSGMAGAQGLGLVVGPAVAPLFVLPFVGLSGPLFAFAVFGFACILVGFYVLPDQPPAPPPSGAHAQASPAGFAFWADPRLAPFLICMFLTSTCQTILGQVLGFMLIDRLQLAPVESQGYIATAMMAGAGGLLVAQWGLIPRLRLTPRLLLRLGPATAAAGALVVGFAPSFAWMVGGYALACLGFGLMRPGVASGISLSVAPHEQARAGGAMAATFGSTNMVGPLAGILLYHWHAPAPYVASAVVLLGLVVFAFTHRTLRSVA